LKSLDWYAVVRQIAKQGRILARADLAIVNLRSIELHSSVVGSSPLSERSLDAVPEAMDLAEVLLKSGLPDHFPAPESGDIVIQDLAEVADCLGENGRMLPSASSLRAPIFSQNRWVGDLLVLRVSPEDTFTQGDADVMKTFINQAHLALENSWLYQRAREQAATDPITNLPNHRSLKEHLSAALAEAWQHGRSTSVVMLDLDHFKAFNDALSCRWG
jgi:GAF domain-containing protein